MIILYADIEAIEQPEFEKLLEYVPLTSKDRIMSYGFAEGKYRAVVGELLARYAICILKDVDAIQSISKFTVERTEAGKPFFSNENFHYNISHSGKFVVCAADSEKIGVDIEQIRKCNYRVAEKFFNAAELEELNGAVNIDRKFVEIWTRKESCIKADGRGFGYPDVKNITLGGFEIINLHIHEDYVMSVCFKARDDHEYNGSSRIVFKKMNFMGFFNFQGSVRN